MAGRYDPEMVRVMRARLAEVAREEGLAFADGAGSAIRPSTFAAHRLLTAARETDPEMQKLLADDLFRACWARAEDVGDAGVLAAAAERAGMTARRAGEIIAGDAYAAEVRAEERRAAALGIHAVPTFVFDETFAVSGAQPASVLAEAVRRALSTTRGR